MTCSPLPKKQIFTFLTSAMREEITTGLYPKKQGNEGEVAALGCKHEQHFAIGPGCAVIV